MKPWTAGWNGPPNYDLVQKKKNMFVQYEDFWGSGGMAHFNMLELPT